METSIVALWTVHQQLVWSWERELTHFCKTKIGNLDLCRAIRSFLRQEDILEDQFRSWCQESGHAPLA